MAEIKQLTPAEANDILASGEDAVYLDVRTEEEFAAGHPEGAINIPILFRGPGGPSPNPDFLAVVEKVIPKEKVVLCGCQTGGRSQMAAGALAGAGYEKVSNVDGGFGGKRDGAGRPVVPGWHESGLPVTVTPAAGASYAELKGKAGV